ncbi:hypothetical protein PFISCL1PPCAC_2183 [Pristionchus fissidentatus]|uniref:Secreted protein n=1 Tax=Pristionchus fissidentatus TaxID=1538716 RepID=A0AAV5UUU5_9BILA|nr:hypothetical protein PFISCL1PPCAC_2183 [Pristionchus fissidentatus]
MRKSSMRFFGMAELSMVRIRGTTKFVKERVRNCEFAVEMGRSSPASSASFVFDCTRRIETTTALSLIIIVNWLISSAHTVAWCSGSVPSTSHSSSSHTIATHSTTSASSSTHHTRDEIARSHSS